MSIIKIESQNKYRGRCSVRAISKVKKKGRDVEKYQHNKRVISSTISIFHYVPIANN